MKKNRILLILLPLLLLSVNFLFAQDLPVADPAGPPPADQKEEASELRGVPISGDLLSEEEDKKGPATEDEKKLLKQEAMWKNSDYRGYYTAFADLHRLSKDFANNKYRLALSSYQSGMNTVLKMREGVDLYRKEQAEKKRMNEKYYWQKMDRRSREEAYVHKEKMAAKLAAVTYFTKAINHLDEIANPDLRERKEFKTLLSAVYRAWVMSEYDTDNLPQCIPILELYLEIDDNELEYPAHKYLASCYAFEEKTLKNYGKASTDQLAKMKYKKNLHLLRATELKYGKGSIEYKYIVDLVNRDEIISVNP
jgi:hypothetical protein